MLSRIFFLTKEKKYMPFTYIFETVNLFFWQDTNLLPIQNTYHHQMAVVPWESRYNSETTLTLISVCLLFTLFPTHFSWNEWEFIQQSRYFWLDACVSLLPSFNPQVTSKVVTTKNMELNISNRLWTGSDLEQSKKVASRARGWPIIFHPTPLGSLFTSYFQ